MWTWIFNSLKTQATIWRSSFSENFSYKMLVWSYSTWLEKSRVVISSQWEFLWERKWSGKEYVQFPLMSAWERDSCASDLLREHVQVKLTREWGKKERSRCWCRGSWSLSAAWFHRNSAWMSLQIVSSWGKRIGHWYFQNVRDHC